MNNAPYFSIVIPTKNRPQYLDDSIKSVLLQDFEDYELIVSDNFNGEETRQVINKYREHPRFTSLRTEKELNMLDHWEFATSRAKGKYVIVLADRKLFYQQALKKIHRLTEKHPTINAFSFGFQMYDEDRKQMGWSESIGKTRLLETKDLLSNFLQVNMYSPDSFDRILPKNTHGFFRNAFAQEVRKRFGHYFNTRGAITPDYSSFFINCALNEKTLYIGEKIVLTQGEKTSNGRNFGKGSHEHYMNSLGLADPYGPVPLKIPFIYSLLCIDFLVIQAAVQGRLAGQQIDFKNYFKTCYYEVLNKRAAGMNEEGYAFFMDSWKEVIKDYKNLDAEKIMQEAEAAYREINKPQRTDKLNRFSYHVKDYLALRYATGSWINRIIPFRFVNSLDAAGFETMN